MDTMPRSAKNGPALLIHETSSEVVKTTSELLSLTQGQLDAIAQSGKILAEGMQEIGKSATAAAQASLDDIVNTIQEFSKVKSLQDVMELQVRLCRSSMERTVARTNSFAGSWLKLSEQAFAPIGACLSLTAEKVGRVAETARRT